MRLVFFKIKCMLYYGQTTSLCHLQQGKFMLGGSQVKTARGHQVTLASLTLETQRSSQQQKESKWEKTRRCIAGPMGDTADKGC